jgi:hypothetical protein
MIDDKLEDTGQNILGEHIKGRKRLKGHPKFDLEFLTITTRAVAAGFTEEDLGYLFGVSKRKIQGWKKDPLFKQACTDGKRLAKNVLVATGLRVAQGYDYTEENVKIKTRINKETDEIEEYVAERSTFHKHQKPDSTMLAFMLCNLSRQLKEDEPFVSQHKVEIDEHRDIHIHASGEKALEHIDSLAGAFKEGLTVIDAEFIDGKTRTEKSGKQDGNTRRLPPGDSKRSAKKHPVQKEPASKDGK